MLLFPKRVSFKTLLYLFQLNVIVYTLTFQLINPLIFIQKTSIYKIYFHINQNLSN
ncbi:hypothetical protein pb186bvf_016637 [Paramecium bursaria]